MSQSGSIARGVVVALACHICFPAAPARAELPATAADLSKAANEKVEALTAKTREKGDLPRLAIPDEAAILVPFWDVRTMLGSAPYRKQDLGTLMDMLQTRNAVFTQYVTFKPNGVAEADAERNLSIFQDEIFRSMRFMVQIVGAAIPAIHDQIGERKAGELPAKVLEGFREARDGMLQLVTGSVQMLTHPGLRQENQAFVVDALADNATTLSAALTAKGRAALVEATQGAIPSLPPSLKNRIQVLVTALSTQTCQGLCEIE